MLKVKSVLKVHSPIRRHLPTAIFYVRIQNVYNGNRKCWMYPKTNDKQFNIKRVHKHAIIFSFLKFLKQIIFYFITLLTIK